MCRQHWLPAFILAYLQSFRYNKTIEIEKPNGESEIFDAPDDMTDEQLQAKILFILDIEENKLGREVRKILESDGE